MSAPADGTDRIDRTDLPQAILFDMDDTIIAYDHGLELDDCWRSACTAHLSGSVYEAHIDDVIAAIRRQARWYWSDPERHRIGRHDLVGARTEIIAEALRQLTEQNDASDALPMTDIFGRIAYDYSTSRDALVFEYPGAIATLERLQKAGIPIALITNGASAPQRKKIERFGLDRYCDPIIVEEEFGKGKPDPSVYLHVLDRLGVEPQHAWMVGDNYEWEIVAPQSIGLRGVWLNHKGIDLATLPVQPYRTIRNLPELLQLLQLT